MEIKSQADKWASEATGTAEESPLKSVKEIEKLRPKLAKAAQEVYDSWELDEDGFDCEVGQGGVCHIIADALADVLVDNDIEVTTVSSDHEVHVWVAALVEEGIYLIDIPYGLYETGGGYSWQKIPDVEFEARDIVIDLLTADTDEWGDYTDE